MALIAAVVVVGCADVDGPLVDYTPGPFSSTSLQYSKLADRSSALTLGGATLGSTVYIFTANATNTVRVDFSLDGNLSHSESSAPWDFAGSSAATANPFDTKTLVNGSHTIAAKYYFGDGTSQTAQATFAVNNAPPPAVVYSTSTARTSPMPLNGAVFGGQTIYIFAVDTGTTSKVSFSVDGQPIHVESFAPYDYAGSTTTGAIGTDLSTWTAGSHRIDALYNQADGTTVSVSATFMSSPPRAGAALGVYKGAPGAPDHGPVGTLNFATWVGNPVAVAVDFASLMDWASVEGPGWQLGAWKQWKEGAPLGQARKLIYIAGEWAGTGSLSQGATGAYDTHWVNLAKNLVAYNLADTDIRILHEFSGGWYAWAACGQLDAFKIYFRRIVTAMRSVPGQHFTFTFNPNIGMGSTCAASTTPYNPADAWPGDAYVDNIGLDYYDDDYGAYPTSGTITQTMRDTAWSDQLNHPAGLTAWASFATLHAKPLVFCEWGLWNVGPHHGGGDNASYIQRMHDWIASHNVAYQAYFDFNADGDHRISNPDTIHPVAAALYKSLY